MNKFGDGLTTLLMLALGLGCLNMVVHGLMEGVVGGGNGATFPFASKPIKFVLIELFWTGFGLLLLFGAWRGASRQTAEADDERDDDDEDTRPARLAAKPLAAHSAEVPTQRASIPAGTPSPNLARTFPPVHAVPLASASNLNNKPAAPPLLELHTSRFYAVLVMVLFTAFILSTVYTALALANVFGWALAGLLIAPTMLAYLMIMVQCVRNFFWEGPVLVFDQFGITNYRKGGHLIPWTQVDAARLDARYSSSYLLLRFRHASDVHAHFGKSRWLEAIGMHLFYKGFEGRVKLTTLVFTRSTVLQTAQGFIRYSRR